MSLHFGHTHVRNFGRIFAAQPRLLTRNPYLNFLREFKQDHPKSGFKRLLREAARRWKRMEPCEKAAFTQKEVMKRYRKRSRTYYNRNTLPSLYRVFSRHHIPMGVRHHRVKTPKNEKPISRAMLRHLRRRYSTAFIPKLSRVNLCAFP